MERELQKAGYFKGGLAKIKAASCDFGKYGAFSKSFQMLSDISRRSAEYYWQQLNSLMFQQRQN